MLIILLLLVVLGLKNPAFYSWGNIFGLTSNMVVKGFLAIGMFFVLISKGIDVSSTTIAAFSMYVTSKTFMNYHPDASFVTLIIFGVFVGLLLGCINGFLISYFNLPVLIITLGTASLFSGALHSFIGTANINTIPSSLITFSQIGLFRYQSVQGQLFFLPIFCINICMFFNLNIFLLKKTMFGRILFAIGGDQESARRIGINVKRYLFTIYLLVGFLAGIAGIIHISLLRNVNPFDLIGSELDIITAYVVGGVSLSGGKGSIVEVFLGLLLITIMNNSLILLGVPSYWQKFFLGLILIVSIGITSISKMILENKNVA